jgi:MtN3 and saliva related transmembrane protein
MLDATSSAMTDWLGTCAALLTTGSFFPQALLTLRSKDVSGISTGMYSFFTAGVALWLVYGVLLGQWPIIIANAVTLVLAALILVTKLRVESSHRAG